MIYKEPKTGLAPAHFFPLIDLAAHCHSSNTHCAENHG